MRLPGSWRYRATRCGSTPASAGAGSEVAGGDASQGTAAEGVQAGSAHGLHRPADGGRVGKLCGLHRELRELGYDAGYSILKGYVSPRRRCRQPAATMRFVTAPGEQAQVDWGSLSYISAGGKQRRVWVLVMTMGWSRACYVELVAARRTPSALQPPARALFLRRSCGGPAVSFGPVPIPTPHNTRSGSGFRCCAAPLGNSR